MTYKGRDIKQWDHYRTPRVADNFHVDRHRGDRSVMVAVCVIGWLLLAAIMFGIV